MKFGSDETQPIFKPPLIVKCTMYEQFYDNTSTVLDAMAECIKTTINVKHLHSGCFVSKIDFFEKRIIVEFDINKVKEHHVYVFSLVGEVLFENHKKNSKHKGAGFTLNYVGNFD